MEKIFQKITNINLINKPKEEEKSIDDVSITNVLTDKENILISTSNGLIYIFNKKTLSLKLSKKIIPEEYWGGIDYFIKLENDIFIAFNSLTIVFLKIFLPQIKIIGYSLEETDKIVQIKSNLFIFRRNNEAGEYLPELILIEFDFNKKGKKHKYLEGEEIDSSILDYFYIILQEHDFSHYQSNDLIKNFLNLNENEIVVAFEESGLKFIKIKDNKSFDKKDIKSIPLKNINEYDKISLFFLKENNFLLCGFKEGLFVIDNSNKTIIKKLLTEYVITTINILLNRNIILGVKIEENEEEMINLIEYNLEQEKIIRIKENISDYELYEIIEIKNGSILINYKTENVEIWKQI